MKIDPSLRPAAPRGTAPGAAPDAGIRRPGPAAGAAASARVSTGSARADGPGTFDAGRVAQIREDIRAGRYQVRPERIADGLLDSVRELLGTQQAKRP